MKENEEIEKDKEEVVKEVENEKSSSSKEDEENKQSEEVDLEEKLKKTEEMLKAEKEKYIQVYADFENRSKRLEKEKQSAIDYSSEKFAIDLLPIMDTLELALQSANVDAEPKELLEKLKEGINLTLDNFEKTFKRHGIETIETEGEFDPNFHQAVTQMASENHEDGHIVSTMQKGYTLKGRLLRASMVAVCKK
jgi:molecular chaperone GrpE